MIGSGFEHEMMTCELDFITFSFPIYYFLNISGKIAPIEKIAKEQRNRSTTVVQIE